MRGTQIFWFATALMATVAIATASTAANPAFIVCAPSALLLGLVTVINQALRRAKRKREGIDKAGQFI